uniref:C-type lectin domain-containing protein n=1 Tax=Seriola dumerili TaxID=41447 RepID=A0A3B4T4U8_SERDU
MISLWLCSVSSCLPQHKYVLVTTPKTWYEAQSYCRENCFDLATIDDMGEMKTLLKTVEDNYDDGLWIGLGLQTTKMWHWTLADKDFYKEGERNYLVWGQQTLDNCGYYNIGKLYSTACNIELHTVCFDGDCHSFAYIQMLTWYSARDYCRTYHTDLVSVRNKAESDIIQKVAKDLKVWTGLFRDVWSWSDGTYSSLRYWKVGQPVFVKPGSNKCAAFLKSESGRWGAQPCGEVHPFICNCKQTSSFRFFLLSMWLQIYSSLFITTAAAKLVDKSSNYNNYLSLCIMSLPLNLRYSLKMSQTFYILSMMFCIWKPPQ